MRAAGVETIVNSDELAIMGIVEVGRVLPRFISAFRKLRAAAIREIARCGDSRRLAGVQSSTRLFAAPPRFESDLLHQSATVGVAASAVSARSSATSICCCRYFRSKSNGTRRAAWTMLSLSVIRWRVK